MRTIHQDYLTPRLDSPGPSPLPVSTYFDLIAQLLRLLAQLLQLAHGPLLGSSLHSLMLLLLLPTPMKGTHHLTFIKPNEILTFNTIFSWTRLDLSWTVPH